MKLFESLSYPMLVLFCLTLGLAPFTPEPHVWEKLKMLFSGELRAAIDWFDLVMHGFPWVLLALKGMNDLKAARG